MIEAILYGLVAGVALCLTFGTVFFSLLQNSVDNGYRAGIKIAFGVVVCDCIFVACALFGTSFLPKIEGFEFYLTLFGSILLLLMGIANLSKGAPRLAYPKTRFGNFLYYFSTGFLLNAINPVNFITWVTLAAYLDKSLHYSLPERYAFMLTSLVGIFLTESTLAVFAHRLKHFFTPKVVLWFNRTTGVVFIFVALQLAWTRLSGPLLELFKQ